MWYRSRRISEQYFRKQKKKKNNRKTIIITRQRSRLYRYIARLPCRKGGARTRPQDPSFPPLHVRPITARGVNIVLRCFPARYIRLQSKNNNSQTRRTRHHLYSHAHTYYTAAHDLGSSLPIIVLGVSRAGLDVKSFGFKNSI